MHSADACCAVSRLNFNRLTSLPESFGALHVGGNLYVHTHHPLSLLSLLALLSLPWCGSSLETNQLASLPESFSNVDVRGDL